MGIGEGASTEAKELTIKDKITKIDRLTTALIGFTDYCLNSFQDNSTPEKDPTKSDMDHELDLIIDRLDYLVANLYIS